MNVLKWSEQINYPGLRVMSLSLHQWCIIIILFTSYKSHIVSIVCPCWDEQGKLLGHHHGSTLDNLLGFGHFWKFSYLYWEKKLCSPRNLLLKQWKNVKNVAFIRITMHSKTRKLPSPFSEQKQIVLVLCIPTNRK